MTDALLDLYPLSFVPEGDDVVVGRLDTGSYAVLPSDGARLLRQLCDGKTPAEAADWYEAEFGEEIDIEDFVKSLHELGFVREADSAAPEPVRPVRFQRLGRALFSASAWIGYAAIFGYWLLTIVRHPDVRPSPHQIFFTGSLLVVQAVVTFAQIPLLLLHEGFHILAGRRLALPSKLRMSNRLVYVVFETQMNGLMSVARRRRYLPFVAGMLCDVVVLALLGTAADVDRDAGGSIGLTGRVCLAMGFTVVMRLAWQLQLFLRTDVYYVFVTALNCYDLHEASKALLRNRIWRRLGRPDRVVDEEQWSADDRRIGAWYGPFLVLGVLTLIAITVFATGPIIFQYFLTIVRHLASGRIDAAFWDAAVSLGINVAQAAALVYFSRSKRRHQSSARMPARLQGVG